MTDTNLTHLVTSLGPFRRISAWNMDDFIVIWSFVARDGAGNPPGNLPVTVNGQTYYTQGNIVLDGNGKQIPLPLVEVIKAQLRVDFPGNPYIEHISPLVCGSCFSLYLYDNSGSRYFNNDGIYTVYTVTGRGVFVQLAAISSIPYSPTYLPFYYFFEYGGHVVINQVPATDITSSLSCLLWTSVSMYLSFDQDMGAVLYWESYKATINETDPYNLSLNYVDLKFSVIDSIVYYMKTAVGISITIDTSNQNQVVGTQTRKGTESLWTFSRSGHSPAQVYTTTTTLTQIAVAPVTVAPGCPLPPLPPTQPPSTEPVSQQVVDAQKAADAADAAQKAAQNAQQAEQATQQAAQAAQQAAQAAQAAATAQQADQAQAAANAAIEAAATAKAAATQATTQAAVFAAQQAAQAAAAAAQTAQQAAAQTAQQAAAQAAQVAQRTQDQTNQGSPAPGGSGTASSSATETAATQNAGTSSATSGDVLVPLLVIINSSPSANISNAPVFINTSGVNIGSYNQGAYGSSVGANDDGDALYQNAAFAGTPLPAAATGNQAGSGSPSEAPSIPSVGNSGFASGGAPASSDLQSTGGDHSTPLAPGVTTDADGFPVQQVPPAVSSGTPGYGTELNYTPKNYTYGMSAAWDTAYDYAYAAVYPDAYTSAYNSAYSSAYADYLQVDPETVSGVVNADSISVNSGNIATVPTQAPSSMPVYSTPPAASNASASSSRLSTLIGNTIAAIAATITLFYITKNLKLLVPAASIIAADLAALVALQSGTAQAGVGISFANGCPPGWANTNWTGYRYSGTMFWPGCICSGQNPCHPSGSSSAPCYISPNADVRLTPEGIWLFGVNGCSWQSSTVLSVALQSTLDTWLYALSDHATDLEQAQAQAQAKVDADNAAINAANDAQSNFDQSARSTAAAKATAFAAGFAASWASGYSATYATQYANLVLSMYSGTAP